MLYYILRNLASLKVLETYFEIDGVLKTRAIVLLPNSLYTFTGLNVSPQSNISHFSGYKLGKSFADDSDSCLFKVVICNCI